jgi:SAM-dependent methyltransferase
VDASAYAAAWLRDASLEDLNADIHDGASADELAGRAGGIRDLMFHTLYPEAHPRSGSRALEFGSGVGWIMQAMAEGFDLERVVGLDISKAIARRGRQRVNDPRITFTVYDGFRFPFRDDSFSTVYSTSAIHHVEKHVAFLLFKEMYRVLAPGGHAVLQVLSVHHLPRSVTPFETECWNHVRMEPVYWHHYYALDEIVVLFSEVLGVDDLDVKPWFGIDCFFIHFSKGTGRRFLRPELVAATYPERLRAAAGPAAPKGPPHASRFRLPGFGRAILARLSRG